MERIGKPFSLLVSLAASSMALTMLTWLMIAGTAHGKNCNVPTQTYPTIQSAVTDSSCATVNLTESLYAENVVINRTVALQGTGETTIVDGMASGRVFDIQSGVTVTLTDLTITNGLSPLYPGTGIRQPGAGINIEGSTLTVSATTIMNNRGGSGAGLYGEDSTIVIRASAFISNESDQNNAFHGGGGMYVVGDGNVMINDSLFRGNLSNELCGAICIVDGSLTLNDTMIVDNSSREGGGIYNAKGQVEISDSTFMSNTASGSGGGINNGWKASRMTVLSTTLEGNSGDGGGIANYGWFTLTNSTVSHNLGTTYAAGILNDDSGKMLISNTVVSTNTNASAIRNEGVLTVTTSLLKANHTVGNGGAVSNAGTASIISSNLISNRAGFNGGAIHQYLGFLTIMSSTLSANSAGRPGLGISGGALYNDSGYVTITNSTLSSNISSFIGGAIYNRGSSILPKPTRVMRIINSTLSNNHAQQDGGAIFNDADAIVELRNSTLAYNSSERVGSSLHSGWNGDPEIRLANSIILTDASIGNCGGEGTITSLGHNIDTGNTCNLTAAGDLPNTNLILASLQDYGGPTWTHALLPGSPAIDAGDDVVCAALPVNGVDQRGVPRPQGVACDIGAYEGTLELPFSTVLPIVLR